MSKGLEMYKNFIDGLVEQKNGVDSKRILGKGYPNNEENYRAKQYVMSQDIPEQGILIEDKSTITQENLENAKVLMDEAGYQTVVIVSYSPLFKKKGFSVRVPLHIKQVKIQKALSGEKYRLSFRLNDAGWLFEKFKIVFKNEYPKMKSQKENVDAFLSDIVRYT